MQELIQPTDATLPSQRRPLGFLIEPMDWAARALIERANSAATVSGRLLEIGRARMHVIAIALAHDAKSSLPVEQLLHERLSEILDKVLAPKPAGMHGVINRLPPRVLQPESYRCLVALMRDARVADVLAHGDALDDRSVVALAGVPAPLRRVVLAAMEDEIASVAGLTEGLRWFADRGAAASYEALVADLARRRQKGQLIARLRSLVEALPWPERGPPARVGPADRIDKPDAIRCLAKAWQNCLADYLEHIEEGRCAAYQWLAPPGPIIALVQRHGRLGWFLEQIGSPNNGDVTDGTHETVESAFLGVGIPPAGSSSQSRRFLAAWTLSGTFVADRADGRTRVSKARLMEEYGPDVALPDLRTLVAKCDRAGSMSDPCGAFTWRWCPSSGASAPRAPADNRNIDRGAGIRIPPRAINPLAWKRRRIGAAMIFA